MKRQQRFTEDELQSEEVYYSLRDLLRRASAERADRVIITPFHIGEGNDNVTLSIPEEDERREVFTSEPDWAKIVAAVKLKAGLDPNDHDPTEGDAEFWFRGLGRVFINIKTEQCEDGERARLLIA